LSTHFSSPLIFFGFDEVITLILVIIYLWYLNYTFGEIIIIIVVVVVVVVDDDDVVSSNSTC
jgi:hypothetical protein